MLARLEDYGLNRTRPFHGGLVAHSYPQGLDHDMHQAFEIGVVLSGRQQGRGQRNGDVIGERGQTCRGGFQIHSCARHIVFLQAHDT